jgi:hypothetical protein
MASKSLIARQVRVISDGDGANTTITDSDGKTLENVIEATVYLRAQELTEVSLTLIAPRVDAHGTVTDVTLLCPVCIEHVEHQCPPQTMGGS